MRHYRLDARTEGLDVLLAGLRLALRVGRETDAATLGGVSDWKALADLAKRHRVASLMLTGVQAAQLTDPEPETALVPLRQETVRRGLHQMAGLCHATDCLADGAIPFLVLKGLPLSARLFGTPLARDSVDVDLLVPPEAVPAAECALAAGGWRLLKPSFQPTPRRVRWYDQFVKDRLLARTGVALELHRRLANNPFLLQKPFDGLCANATHVEIAGRLFPTLGDDDLLIYLAVHGQLHRWSRVKWLCDIAALLMAMDKHRFDAAIEQCRRCKLELEPTFGSALVLSRELLRVEPPAGAEFVPLGSRARHAANTTRRIWRDQRGGVGFRGAARRIDEMRNVLAMKRSWRIVAQELSRLCIGPYDFGKVNLPDSLLFLNVPLRPVLWLAGCLWQNGKRTRRARSRRPRGRSS